MNLKERLKKSINEKDVENIYRSELDKIESSTITSPYGVDGLLDSKKIRTLLEFKYEDNFKNKLSQCNVLIQCLYYLKKFENNGDKLPSTIFVGDINECFVIHSNSIVKYLSCDIDWKIAPSEAYKKNPELIKTIVNDENILPFVYDIDDNFSFKTVIDKINDFSNNIVRKIRITKHNLVPIFNYFDSNMLEKVNLTTNEKANLFIQTIINPSENYLHPKRKNVLITKSFGDLSVNQNLFNSFFLHFEGDLYSPKEKEELTSLVDRLIDDTVRRNKGEFFTPTAFVDLGHKYISDQFGEDWKDRFVVWDCAWGTGNLTRDFKFKELYCSTLEQSDIDTANQMGYNMEATKFRFDFLNDSDESLPERLRNAIESGREILFLINPPYIKSTPNKGNDNTGISDTIIGKEMNSRKLGIASSQLSTQFVYKILKLQEKNKNIKIGIFNKPNYMTSDGFKVLREYFLTNFGFIKGFLFNASHFSDTASSWGISFSIWDSNFDGNKNQFIHKIVDSDDSFNIVEIGEKILYNCDSIKKANIIFKDKEKNDIFLPPIKSFVTIEPKKEKLGCTNAIGYINNHSNNLMQQQVVFLASSVISANGNKAITPDKFYSVMNLFTARKSVLQNWINDKDEYLAPNENHPEYEQFTYDSIVYSLFNNSSQQSSLRQVSYKDKLWDIKNEFFWISKKEIQQLANDSSYDEIYKDARTSDERFVYKQLFESGIYEKLSNDAKEVLDIATDLTKRSFEMRKLVSENNPEYHLDSWDAGYAQLKLVWKDYFKDEFKSFRDKYKSLEDRMRPLVYRLGFLKE